MQASELASDLTAATRKELLAALPSSAASALTSLESALSGKARNALAVHRVADVLRESSGGLWQRSRH